MKRGPAHIRPMSEFTESAGWSPVPFGGVGGTAPAR
jgi:hypothetical protein